MALGTLRHFLELIRFSHTLFALPFALSSAVLAWHAKGGFSWLELAGILLCMVFARSASMAFNRLADQDIDARNPRTAGRHLPSGQLSRSLVWVFTLACVAGFLASTAVFLWAEPSNPWPLRLGVPVLLFVLGYSYAKRFTSLAHFWLGVSLLLAPVAAWIAIRGMEGLGTPTLLGLAVLFWVAGFDMIYACQDVDFDRQARLHSVPVRFGVAGALRLAFVCHVLMVVALVSLAVLASPPLGIVFRIGVAAVALLLLYEHWLVSPKDLGRVNQAFFHVNVVISLGLFVVILTDTLLARG